MTLDETIKRFEALAESYESYVESINPKELAEWLKELKERRATVKLGIWIDVPTETYSDWYKCSNCKYTDTKKFNFCPRCGAKMPTE